MNFAECTSYKVSKIYKILVGYSVLLPLLRLRPFLRAGRGGIATFGARLRLVGSFKDFLPVVLRGTFLAVEFRAIVSISWNEICGRLCGRR